MKNIYKNLFVLALIVGGLTLMNSCADEGLMPEPPMDEVPPVNENIYSVNFVVTLDNMGSNLPYDRNADPAEITKWENYINLERFRVLFFDSEDKFLFESKNRWVKQVDAGDSFSSWFVSVPLGKFGNDSYGNGLEYDWDGIRTALTSGPFKIAILANRPAQLLYPGFMDSELSLDNGVFDNDGPYWGPAETGEKTLFDLQHYQYDIIYTDKGEHGTKTNSSYYDFIMSEINTDRPQMGAAINWVSFDNNDTDKTLLSGSNYMRNIKMPGKDHPIPMYGVQIFSPIPEKLWKPGTPFDISNLPAESFPNVEYPHSTISLLRCCVRLDLKIPKSVMSGKQPTFVTLWYSNIYSRTEPMDNWTPTNLIWNQNNAPHGDDNCEFSRLNQYGPMVTNSSPGNGTTKALYQQRLKWFYGAWLDKNWDFKTKDGSIVKPEKNGIEYPRIYNAVIQRNKVIQLNRGDVTNLYPDKNSYWHYIVYTGERAPNDVNSLPNMPSNPYVTCFVISWDNKNFYCIPLCDYSSPDSYLSTVFGPCSTGAWANASPSSEYNTYINTNVPKSTGKQVPYYLLRNHIYKFTLKGTKSGNGEIDDLMIDSEVIATPDIDFSEKVKAAAINAGVGSPTYTPGTATLQMH